MLNCSIFQIKTWDVSTSGRARREIRFLYEHTPTQVDEKKATKSRSQFSILTPSSYRPSSVICHLSERQTHVEALYQTAHQFAGSGHVRTVQNYGSGNVNDTYLVTLDHPATNAATQFVLQRINTHVFRRPELILQNMRTFIDHMQAKQAHETPAARTAWVMPSIIRTHSGADFFVDEQGGFWRAISLIQNAQTYFKIRDAAHARESGYALGRFHRLLSDLDPNLLHDTLPGFHITPQYLANYDEVLAQGAGRADPRQRTQTPAVAYGLQFVEERRRFATILEDGHAQGKLALRSIHGDPKVDNILIDNHVDQAVSIIDLDTVKPGLVHYDIGDCLRSCCNPAGEDVTDLSAVTFDTDLCRVILEGYLGEAAGFFTANDYAYLFDSIRLIAFELGLRFFTDYLTGDVYFKVRHAEHNLQRALVQFRLAEQIEAREQEIRAIIEENQRG